MYVCMYACVYVYNIYKYEDVDVCVCVCVDVALYGLSHKQRHDPVPLDSHTKCSKLCRDKLYIYI
jgi:hypothetical protein